MLDSRIAEIARRLVVEAGVAQAAAIGLSFRERGAPCFVTGAAFDDGRPEHGVARAFFDLASVTKPFLAVTLARLVERGRLQWSTPLAQILPEAAGTETGAYPVSLLLAHRAGLDAHEPLFAPLFGGLPFERATAVRRALQARRSECSGQPAATSHSPLYSDLGYLLLGLAVEGLEGLPLDQIVAREVCAPLGLDVGSARLLRRHHDDFYERCLPTETVPARGGEVRGVVHDENAWALSGHGLCGHAGLFGTALGVTRFGRALLEVLAGRLGAFLGAGTLAFLLEPRPHGTLLAGFDGKSADQSSAGERAGPRTFGHLGFTGTSLWCDPDADRVMVLLTNRVCPTRQNARIRSARPRVNDALFTYSR